MARRKRASANDQPIGVGLTTKQMKRKETIKFWILSRYRPT